MPMWLFQLRDLEAPTPLLLPTPAESHTALLAAVINHLKHSAQGLCSAGVNTPFCSE